MRDEVVPSIAHPCSVQMVLIEAWNREGIREGLITHR